MENLALLNLPDEILHMTVCGGMARVLLMRTTAMSRKAAQIHQPSDTALAAMGRLMTATAMLGSVLNIKPILHLATGKLESYKKARGMNKACEAMLESIRSDLAIRFQEAHSRGDVFLMAAGSADEQTTAKWLKQIETAFPGMPIQYDDLSMGVSCHTGEGALGIGLRVRPRI